MRVNKMKEVKLKNYINTKSKRFLVIISYCYLFFIYGHAFE